MKSQFLALALVLSTLTPNLTFAAPADSVLFEGVSCAIFIRKDGKELFAYGESGRNRLQMAFNSEMQLSDKTGQTWTVSTGAGVLGPDQFDTSMAKEVAGGLVVKKEILDDVNMNIHMHTDAFKKKIGGKYAKLLSDTYSVSAGTSGGAKSLTSHAGSFTSEISASVNCSVKSRDVNFNDL